jgi:hypothetical protein
MDTTTVLTLNGEGSKNAGTPPPAAPKKVPKGISPELALLLEVPSGGGAKDNRRMSLPPSMILQQQQANQAAAAQTSPTADQRQRDMISRLMALSPRSYSEPNSADNTPVKKPSDTLTPAPSPSKFPVTQAGSGAPKTAFNGAQPKQPNVQRQTSVGEPSNAAPKQPGVQRQVSAGADNQANTAGLKPVGHLRQSSAGEQKNTDHYY